MAMQTIGILLVAALVGYFVASYAVFAYRISVGKKLARDAQAYSRDGDFSTSILVVGDSTAVGTGGAPQESVAGRLAEHYSANVENRAVNGAQLKDVAQQLREALSESYDFVVIHAGANDVIYGSTYADMQKYASEVAAEAVKLSERVVLITSGDIGEAPIWPFPLGSIFTKRTEKAREIIKPTVEENGAAYVDLFAMDTPFARDPKRYYAPDFLHLSGDGYEVWFNAIRTTIETHWEEYASSS